MANRVCIQPCKFVDLDEKGNEIETYYGYRVYDDYGKTYNNILSEEELINLMLDPLAALEAIQSVSNDWENFLEEVFYRGGFFSY